MHNIDLIEKLLNCAAACEHCANACLDEHDIKMMVDCIRLDRDCADICRITANYAARDSKNLNEVVRLCAGICRACAEECEKHKHPHCKECAKACRECEEVCKNLMNV